MRDSSLKSKGIMWRFGLCNIHRPFESSTYKKHPSCLCLIYKFDKSVSATSIGIYHHKRVSHDDDCTYIMLYMYIYVTNSITKIAWLTKTYILLHINIKYYIPHAVAQPQPTNLKRRTIGLVGSSFSELRSSVTRQCIIFKLSSIQNIMYKYTNEHALCKSTQTFLQLISSFIMQYLHLIC